MANCSRCGKQGAEGVDLGAVEGVGLVCEECLKPAREGQRETQLSTLLDGAVEFTARYVHLPGEAEQVTLALFTAHTYAMAGSHATPYLLVTSPERQSGKTRLLEIIDHLVRQPWRTAGCTEAAMFRKIEQQQPTLMLDEIDAIFGSYTERTEPLRGVLNAGNRPGAYVSRCAGDKHEVTDYRVYCAKVLAGIDTGRIPDTIRDRSIPIRMQRKTGAEPVARHRHRFARNEAQGLREGFEEWAATACEALLQADPAIPDELSDRAAEGWEALFAIADEAGPEWAERARRAAVALSAPQESDEQTYGSQLLGAIREAMGNSDRITTEDLLTFVNESDELPFGGWRDGKGLDARNLAKILKRYEVHPKTHDFDGRKAKGYLREQLQEPWDRWLPKSGGAHRDIAVTSVTAVTMPEQPPEQIPLGKAEVTPVTPVTDDSGGATAEEEREATPEEEAEIARLEEKLGEAA